MATKVSEDKDVITSLAPAEDPCSVTVKKSVKRLTIIQGSKLMVVYHFSF